MAKNISANGPNRRRGKVSDAALRKGLATLPVPSDSLSPPINGLPRADAVPASPHLSLGCMAETNGGSSLEKVPGFDAARARNAGLLPSTVAPYVAPVDAEGFVRENVIGDDNLLPIPDTTSLPWRCIAMLTITYEDGARGIGTAWFLGGKALGTAGHNIKDPQHGRATEILVSPAFDGTTALFGTYRVHQTYCDPAWLSGSHDPSLDFGVLVLGADFVGRRLGWFGFASYDDRQLTRLLVNVCGYPARRSSRTQHYNGGRLDEVSRQFLRYTFDTVGGMSGAPIFALFGEQRVVVGIHTSGNDRANRARRIDRSLYELFNRFAAA